MKQSTLTDHFPVSVTILTGFLGAGKTTLDGVSRFRILSNRCAEDGTPTG